MITDGVHIDSISGNTITMDVTRDTGRFGSGTRANVLLLLSVLGESHARELAVILDANVSNVGKAVHSLEQSGVIAGVLIGRTRRIKIDPRYPYRQELLPLLEKMALSNPGLMQAISDVRRRPRRFGKET